MPILGILIALRAIDELTFHVQFARLVFDEST
jgi:hypothetical protein